MNDFDYLKFGVRKIFVHVLYFHYLIKTFECRAVECVYCIVPDDRLQWISKPDAVYSRNLLWLNVNLTKHVCFGFNTYRIFTVREYRNLRTAIQQLLSLLCPVGYVWYNNCISIFLPMGNHHKKITNPFTYGANGSSESWTRRNKVESPTVFRVVYTGILSYYY